MIPRDEWAPSGIDSLESTALDAVCASGSALIVAGPGTGKTELLGQRAAYLFQTGGCNFPRRILAISFKRDAASNLRERVERRCGSDMARRLDSMTFDAFAKQLLDRFWRALPAHIALKGEYGIAPFLSRQGFDDLVRSTADGLDTPGHPAHWAKTLVGKDINRPGVCGARFDDFIGAIQSLRLHPLEISRYGEFLQLVQLRIALLSQTPKLTFPMIGRLAQAIIKANPSIRRAICATYSHVFLDEFQDTTSVQYDLVETIFAGSSANLTAVGDDKQRIMGWAGARSDVFAAFEASFLSSAGAFGRVSLTRNYRSNERIVSILNILKTHLAPTEPDFVAARATPDLPDEKICAVLVANNTSTEADAIAAQVGEAIDNGVDARSIGLLVRQKSVDWEQRIRPSFDARGVAFRNEDRDVGGATIQDLMTENYSRIVVNLLELLTLRHGGTLWTAAMADLASVTNIVIDDDAEAERELALSLDDFHRTNRMKAEDFAVAAEIDAKLIAIEGFLGLERLRGATPHYATGDLFERTRAATFAFLKECAKPGKTWRETIDRFRGSGQTPLLTITKSKGLEYDLVILLGLNDSEWWSFNKDPTEGHSTFFVAASRARERLLMTRCGYDSNAKIGEIFELLRQAGVQHVSV